MKYRVVAKKTKVHGEELKSLTTDIVTIAVQSIPTTVGSAATH